MAELILLFAACCCVQYGLLHLTRSRLRFVRWLLPLTCALPLYSAWECFHTSSFLIGLSHLAALIWLIIAALILAGWGLGWGLFRLAERFCSPEGKEITPHEKDPPL